MLEGKANVDGKVRVEEGREEILRAQTSIEERRGLERIERGEALGGAHASGSSPELLLGRAVRKAGGGRVRGGVHEIGGRWDVAVHDTIERRWRRLRLAHGAVWLMRVEKGEDKNNKALGLEVIPSLAQTIEISRTRAVLG